MPNPSWSVPQTCAFFFFCCLPREQPHSQQSEINSAGPKPPHRCQQMTTAAASQNGLFHYVSCWELQVGPGNHHALTMLHLSNWSECVTHLWATAFVNLDADSRTNYKPSSREESTCSLWTKSTAGRTIATWTTGIMASYWHNQNIIQKPCYAAYLVLRHTSSPMWEPKSLWSVGA